MHHQAGIAKPAGTPKAGCMGLHYDSVPKKPKIYCQSFQKLYFKICHSVMPPPEGALKPFTWVHTSHCYWYVITSIKSLYNPLKPNSSNCYTMPYRFNPLFSISDIRALWRSVLSARVPKCKKLKMVD